MKTNEYILITGSSSGIGRFLAIQLATHHNILIHGRDTNRLAETLRLCLDPHRHRCWQYDLAQVEELATTLEEYLAENNIKIKAFVHCAAMLKLLPFRNTELKNIKETINTNFISAAEITRVLIKKKINQETLRSVVFISSIASKFGAKAFSVYSASKGALDALMRSLAVELAPKVRINSVLPGAIQTPMTTTIFANNETSENLKRDYPLGIGKVEDVANLIEFLLSDQARWITGQQIILDGGRTTNISA